MRAWSVNHGYGWSRQAWPVGGDSPDLPEKDGLVTANGVLFMDRGIGSCDRSKRDRRSTRGIGWTRCLRLEPLPHCSIADADFERNFPNARAFRPEPEDLITVNSAPWPS